MIELNSIPLYTNSSEQVIALLYMSILVMLIYNTLLYLKMILIYLDYMEIILN
mgnify:CR=1 FL=1